MKPIYLLIPLIVFICCKKNTLEKTSDNASFIDFPFLNFSVKIDSTIISNYKNSDLTAFYNNYNNETVWTSQENRSIVLNEFKNATTEGLFPNDYNYDKLNTLNADYNHLDDIKLVEFDLLFTQSIQKYLLHIYKGKIEEPDANLRFASSVFRLNSKDALYEHFCAEVEILNTGFEQWDVRINLQNKRDDTEN